MLTSKSLDMVTDEDKAGACKNKTSDKGSQIYKQNDQIKGATNKYRIRNNFELTISHMEPDLNEQRLIKNDIGDEVSKGKEVSIVCYSGNRRDEDNSPEYVPTVTSNKSYTRKFKSYRKN